MKIKTVTRNLNFDTSKRNINSKYRVKYNDASEFDILQVICKYGIHQQIFTTISSNLSKSKNSIYFLAEKTDDSFIINWCGDAQNFMNISE